MHCIRNINFNGNLYYNYKIYIEFLPILGNKIYKRHKNLSF